MQFSKEFLSFYSALTEPAFPLEGFGCIPGHRMTFTALAFDLVREAYYSVGDDHAQEVVWQIVRGELPGGFCEVCGTDAGTLYALFKEALRQDGLPPMLCLPRPRVVALARNGHVGVDMDLLAGMEGVTCNPKDS